jgi:tRNA G18 (ribose-2'-O)-methylase SpoU
MNNKQLDYQDERKNFQERLEYINARRHPISLLLDGVSDARNIGSVFRLADAANLACIYFYNCPILPNDKRINKTARSTQKYVPSKVLHDLNDVQELKNTHQLIALEITAQSQLYTSLKIQKPSIIIIGAENHGVSEQLLEVVDATIHIPMYGINTSMNVINAASIVTYHFLQSYHY